MFVLRPDHLHGPQSRQQRNLNRKWSLSTLIWVYRLACVWVIMEILMQMESWLESSNLLARLFTILKVSPLWGLATTTDKWGNFLGLRSTSATDRHIFATEWQWVRLASLKLRRVWSLEFEYGESMELSWIESADSSDKTNGNILEAARA